MVRYRRYKRRYSGTRAIKMKFQSFMDIATSPDSMQIITISAGGKTVLERLSPQFAAYKYYRMGSVSVKLVPASTLPVDPTGLSYEAGEPGVDPRDQLTPGLMRITNGEDIFEDITGLDDTTQHGIYNNMLLDPRWFKWMLQSGVKRYATPRFWQIGQLHQDKWPGAIVNLPSMDSEGNVVGTDVYFHRSVQDVGEAVQGHGGSAPEGFFQTGHNGRLGWLPTDDYQRISNDGRLPFIASPPEVEVMKIILPKAYKTKYYYRMFITETVYFKSPIVNFGINAFVDGSGVPFGFRPLDVFHYPTVPSNAVPSRPINNNFADDGRTGGNDGSN